LRHFTSAWRYAPLPSSESIRQIRCIRSPFV
jgi:hypothetical protein